MRFDILTIFPAVFSPYFNIGVLGRAIERGIIDVGLVNIRDFASEPHRCTDDRPFGGGDGMVMKAGPIYRALKSVERTGGSHRVVLLSPQGDPFNQRAAWKLAELDQVILICGRYEGVDERVISTCIDLELSLGDFVLSGGELGAMVVVDAVGRLIPGVLGAHGSRLHDSFEEGRLKYPQYTRPRTFLGKTVPEVLLSGDHERIHRWRRRAALKTTLEKRPDLLQITRLTPEDKALLAELQQES